jgi:hypothetical protein
MVAQSMKEVALTDQDADWRMRVTDYLALEHNVTIVSASVFLLGFGEGIMERVSPIQKLDLWY